MKKLIQILLIFILASIAALIVVFIFNPFDLRTKLIGGVINSYLGSQIEDYKPLTNDPIKLDDILTGSDEPVADKNPLLNEEQEKTLENLGVDVSQLPSTITPGMQTCFIEKLGQARADEIVAGASPSTLEIVKVRTCLDE